MTEVLDRFKNKSFVGLYVSIFSLLVSAAIYGLLHTVYVFIPLALCVLMWIGFTNPKVLFVGLFILLPISKEFMFLEYYGLDVPSDILLIILTGACVIIFAMYKHTIPIRTILNPIGILIVAQVLWIGICCCFSEEEWISVKFLLAKTWYVLPLVFLPQVLFSDYKDFEKLYKYILIALVCVCGYIFIQHGMVGFAFSEINKIVQPFFKNHVSSASLITIIIPYAYYFAWKEHTNPNKRNFVIYVMITVILLVSLYFNFTRIAYVGVLCLPIAYWIIKKKYIVHSIISCGVIVAGFLMYEIKDNTYLDRAPDFDKTINHTNFGKLLTATTKGEDISTMERLYRWVAGAQMITERPIFGYGPGAFYSTYKQHTLTQFQTYVSDNPDKSTVHNNYLLIATEQGIIGFILFFASIILCLYYGQQQYHLLQDKVHASFLLAAMLSQISICVILLVNDMIETDKLGVVYFMNIAIVMYSQKRQNKISSQ